MRGEMDRLQEAAARRLSGLGEFAVADIVREGYAPNGGKACGVKITVRIPMPEAASKYAAGPAFSKVAMQIVIERDDMAARHSPSAATLAEGVTRALHGWTAPLECGYGKVAIAESEPWQRIETPRKAVSAIAVNFKAQSVLE